MTDNTKVGFFNAPMRLVELLGADAEHLLTAWFAAAGYPTPDGHNLPMFSILAHVRKFACATDADQLLNFRYENLRGRGIAIEVIISLMLGEIVVDSHATIRIGICLGPGVCDEGVGELCFSYHSGAWISD